jgi:hypothetical protein
MSSPHMTEQLTTVPRIPEDMPLHEAVAIAKEDLAADGWRVLRVVDAFRTDDIRSGMDVWNLRFEVEETW